MVQAEHERALRLACLLAGDRDLAEDATAEAFARTYEQWLSGRIDDVGAYLRRAVVNQVKNQRRSLARLRRFESRSFGDGRGRRCDADQVAVEHAVVALLARLPHRQRAALVLRYYDDQSEAAIAEALGCRRGTVKSLLSRGLSALRAQAERDGLAERHERHERHERRDGRERREAPERRERPDAEDARALVLALEGAR